MQVSDSWFFRRKVNFGPHVSLSPTPLPTLGALRKIQVTSRLLYILKGEDKIQERFFLHLDRKVLEFSCPSEERVLHYHHSLQDCR